MNIQINRYLTFVVMTLTPTLSIAYELVTHGLVTNQAYNLSKLTQTSNTFGQLGFNGAPPLFSDVYFDFGQQNEAAIFARRGQPYENRIMQAAGVNNSTSMLGWIMRGVIREDDGGFAAGAFAGEPLDDPFDNFNRFCNHFFDPITRNPLSSTLSGDKLSYFGCPNGSNTNAVNWAMGAAQGNNDAFSNSPADANSRNHFSIFAAREAMWRALTLRRKDGTAAPRPDSLYSVPTWTKEDDRKAYWATALRAVGDMLHLNQDMASPQHARNEGHGLGHAALYEKYVDARARRDRVFEFNGEGELLQEIGQLPVVPVGTSYPIPRFNRYSDYWSNALGAASITVGMGLADYSSRGFFTPAKNLGTIYTGFPNPINNENVYSIVTAPGNCTSTPGRAQYATGNLPNDFLVANDPLLKVKYASRSLVNGQWSLNRCVFEERVDLLIPRAVAYSAGLIDYFFRGQLEVTPPDEGVYSVVDHFDFSGAGKTPTDAVNGFKGFKTIKLKLRNATPDIVVSGGGGSVQQTMDNGGTLVAVLKFYRNLNYTDNLSGEPTGDQATAVATYRASRSQAEEIVVSTSVKDGNGNPLTAPFPVTTSLQTFIFEFGQQLPINATDVKLQVVYRGALGSEADAVVVQTVDISEPTYFAYMNASDYIHIGNSVYTRTEINGATPAAAILRSKIQPQTCIDTSTNKLKDTCYKPFAINFTPRWNTNVNSIVGRFVLDDPMTYHRIVTLNPPASSADYDLAASPCLPNDPVSVPGRILQANYVPNPNSPGNYTLVDSESFMPPPVRDVRGWHTIACVTIGDGSIPGTTPDDRNTKMTALPAVNLRPLQVQGLAFP